MHITCGSSSVLPWRECNALCTYDFVDDVMFSRNGVSGPESKTTYVEFARWRHRGDCRLVAVDIVLLCIN